MAFLRNLLGANKIFGRYVAASAADTSKRATSAAPKGFLAVYVGESQKKRYVVPISYLSQPSFQALLNKSEEEYLHPCDVSVSMMMFQKKKKTKEKARPNQSSSSQVRECIFRTEDLARLSQQLVSKKAEKDELLLYRESYKYTLVLSLSFYYSRAVSRTFF
ncbi:hypothetical protein Bca52824_030335 [Brassica carinata]|uniref:Uncharacterized protein n=1 Tax=Brassica carinata TaxID=52824 RepID=A0A8X7S717_BRACI|nr:hypothetical protein Bca52824_030335 [Brassica carinata]